MVVKNKLDYVKDILVSLFGGYVITFLGVIMVALLLLLFQVTEDVVDIGIIVIYVLSCLVTGFIVGKRTKSKKFLWGFLGGSIYFLILFLVSVITQHSMDSIGKELITVLWICIGSGTLGGMLS